MDKTDYANNATIQRLLAKKDENQAIEIKTNF
jgi:hypothetical protein